MTLTISRRTAPTDSQLSRFREEMERTIETMLTEPLVEPRLGTSQAALEPAVHGHPASPVVIERVSVPPVDAR